MRLQYLTDGSGNKTGVFIPIKEWEIMKEKLKEFNFEDRYDIPEKQKEVVRERIEKYKNNPDSFINWKDLEKDLNLD